MAQKALSNSSVNINNEPIRIIPNSLVINDGKGEVNVTTQSSGGGDVETVHGVNVETRIGKCNFSLPPTADNVDKIREWLSNGNANAISVTDENFERVFQNASLTNNPDLALGQDTTLDVEFMSDPAV
jgi:hypothetical protein